MTVDVHPLISPWGRFGLYSYFIDAPEPAIVDTGITSSPAEGMAPALEALGRRAQRRCRRRRNLRGTQRGSP